MEPVEPRTAIRFIFSTLSSGCISEFSLNNGILFSITSIRTEQDEEPSSSACSYRSSRPFSPGSLPFSKTLVSWPWTGENMTRHFYLAFLLATTLLLTHSPSLSAAPNRIAYIDRAGDLYTIRPDGTGRQEMASGEMLQQVSFAPRPVQRDRDFYSWPAWSPNGQRLACFRVEIISGQPTDGLYIFDAASARVLHSYKEPGLQPIYAYWSPTSQQLGVLLGNRRPFSLNLWPTLSGQRPQRVTQGAPFLL